jgi:hypothetical protein
LSQTACARSEFHIIARKQTRLCLLSRSNRLEWSRMGVAGGCRGTLGVRGRKILVWANVGWTHFESTGVPCLELSAQFEVWPGCSVRIDNSLRQQIIDLLSRRRLVSGENVVESPVLADDHDNVLNGGGGRVFLGFSGQDYTYLDVDRQELERIADFRPHPDFEQLKSKG